MFSQPLIPVENDVRTISGFSVCQGDSDGYGQSGLILDAHGRFVDFARLRGFDRVFFGAIFAHSRSGAQGDQAFVMVASSLSPRPNGLPHQ